MKVSYSSVMSLAIVLSTIMPSQKLVAAEPITAIPSSSIEVIAQVNASQLGDLLLELEANIKWSAVEKKWQSRRDAWLGEVQGASSAAQLASLVVDLETNIKWSAVENNWQSRRDSWVRDCAAARNPRQVAKLLVELETNIKWSAVENTWQKRRDSWIQNLTQ